MSEPQRDTELEGQRGQSAANDEEFFHPRPPQEREVPPSPEPTREAEETAPIPTGVDDIEPEVPFSQQVTGAIAASLRNWPVFIILAAFSAAAFIVPTMTQVATTDDWGYTRSVEILLDEGTLKVFPVVAATAVGQVLWGALFGTVFGMSLGMMRVSTVVMVALGGIAIYAILRQLGVSRSRSALGMGVWLFNPLTMALAYSFMTDAHFASVMLISLAFYVRGLRPGREDIRIIVVGSFFAGFAFLIRQQGALIPFGVGTYLLLTGRLGLTWTAARRLLAVALLPAIMFIGYYIWLRWFNDVPDVQEDFLAEIREKGWEGTWLLVRRIPIYTVFYAGILLIPVLAAVFPWRMRDRAASLFSSPVTYYAFLLWTTVVIAGLYHAGRRSHEMPFAPQFVGLGGLGPPDVRGSRQRLVERGSDVTILLTIVAALGAILLGLIICRRLISESNPERAGFWLVAVAGFWQLVGIFPPSYHYTNRGVTLDRYLLPVIAILLIAALWALRDVNLFQPIAWVALALVAAFSIAGVRDYLVFMDAIWDMGEYANENGVENDRLDAGSGWDGYHLYTMMLDENITRSRSPKGSPWWLTFYAKPTDSSYIVTTDPDAQRGYVRVETREYDQWLEDDPVYVHLVKQWYLPFPADGSVQQGTWVWNRPSAAADPEPTVTPGATSTPAVTVPPPQ